jgi:putative DNA primase/helicase
MLLLIGPKRSGKGTIARMLAALVGRGHVVGPTLASLGTNFGLSPLLGRPLAVVSDARLSGNSPTSTGCFSGARRTFVPTLARAALLRADTYR